MIDHQKLQGLVRQLYETVNALERMFPGRHFTPDGHLLGSLGECLVADAYDLELTPASNPGFDALSVNNQPVEIKATQSSSVAFRSCAQQVIVIRIMPDGDFEEIYNGPGHLIWERFEGKPRPSNGQYRVTLSTLTRLNERVSASQRILRKR